MGNKHQLLNPADHPHDEEDDDDQPEDIHEEGDGGSFAKCFWYRASHQLLAH